MILKWPSSSPKTKFNVYAGSGATFGVASRGPMKKIKLTQGKFALIDNQDYWLVADFNWCAKKIRRNWYAHTGIRNPITGHWTTMVMHRLLAGFPPFMLDHINQNGLDNRRKNLRPSNNSMNARNSRLRSDNTTGYAGVTWEKRISKWRVRIGVDRRRINLGYFNDIDLAVTAYQKAKQQYFSV